jgi:internalin A
MSDLAQKLIAECKRTKAKSLDLGYCGLTEIPEEVFDCVWLEELVLSEIFWDEEINEWKATKNEGNKNNIISIP